MVVPKASIAVNRNYDFDFQAGPSSTERPYRFSKPVSGRRRGLVCPWMCLWARFQVYADEQLRAAVCRKQIDRVTTV